MQTPTEIEIKFPVSGLADLSATLQELGARIMAPRHLERNWRFDTPDGKLTQSGRVLRVRQAQGATLTYKERAGQRLTRREIEIDISSSDRATQLLEALGYRAILIYEKYRQVFQLDDVKIMLDTLPFGVFVEIEGPDETAIRDTAERLGFEWEAGVDLSYMEIFEQLKDAAGLDMPNLTFSDFEDYNSDTMALLGLRDALTKAGNTD
jgi:adenylate cyclase, class 2